MTPAPAPPSAWRCSGPSTPPDWSWRTMPDSYGVVGDLRVDAFPIYVEIDWAAVGMPDEAYWQDLCELLVWEPYSLTWQNESLPFKRAMLLMRSCSRRSCSLWRTSIVRPISTVMPMRPSPSLPGCTSPLAATAATRPRPGDSTPIRSGPSSIWPIRSPWPPARRRRCRVPGGGSRRPGRAAPARALPGTHRRVTRRRSRRNPLGGPGKMTHNFAVALVALTRA